MGTLLIEANSCQAVLSRIHLNEQQQKTWIKLKNIFQLKKESPLVIVPSPLTSMALNACWASASPASRLTFASDKSSTAWITCRSSASSNEPDLSTSYRSNVNSSFSRMFPFVANVNAYLKIYNLFKCNFEIFYNFEIKLTINSWSSIVPLWSKSKASK